MCSDKLPESDRGGLVLLCCQDLPMGELLLLSRRESEEEMSLLVSVVLAVRVATG